MKFIDEKIIDTVLEKLDTIEEEFEKFFDDFVNKQPAIIAFLDKENTSVLSDEELEYLEYMSLVIFKSIEKEYKNIPVLSIEMLSETEEINWGLLESAKGKHFNDKLDVFFENYSQEDLLAFIEDGLTEDLEDPEANMDFITDEGREPMFVALKSILDAFDKAIA